MFDSIIKMAMEKFGLSNKAAGGLLAALLGMIADPKGGGFGGFIDKFKGAGLGDAAASWIADGDNTPLSDAEVTSALGSEAISSLAKSAGVDTGAATTALGGMIPGVVDTLTPDGVLPDDEGLLSKIGGFLSDWGVAIGGAVLGGVGAAAAMAGGAADKVGDVAGAAVDKGKEVISGGVGAVGDAAGAVGDVAGAAKDKVVGAVGSVADAFDGDGDGGGVLKWLIPLILLGLLLLLGYWFCGKGAPPTPANGNANKPTVTNTNTNANANKQATNVTSDANVERKLADVVLPDGTKLQAYPGGIEDQLIKFIGSEYKTATAEQLKEKWFSFDDLNFKFGSTELEDSSKRQLDNIVAILKANPDVKIKVGGYTDKKGDDNANLKLSDGRAKAVQAALQKAGVGAQVPEAEGYGEQFAKVDEGASDEERKVDRKIAVRLIK